MRSSKSGTRRGKRNQGGPKRPAKKKTASPDVQVQTKRPAATPNGKLIQDLMVARSVKGDYRDFVMITGNRLVDWLNSWDIFNSAGDPVGFEGVLLVHKSKIETLVDERFAARFWDKRLHRRVIPTQAERNPDVARRPT